MKALEPGDVVLAKDISAGQDVVYLLLERRDAHRSENVFWATWRCLILHSHREGLEPGTLRTPVEHFLAKGELL